MKKLLTFHPHHNLSIDFKDKEIGAIGRIIGNSIGLKPFVRCLKRPGEGDFLIEGQHRSGSQGYIHLFYKLFRYAKEFSLLHLFHISLPTFICVFLFRLRNSKGFIYIKTDSPLREYGEDKRKKIKIIPIFLRSIFFKKVDVIGFEDQELLAYYQKIFPKYKDKMVLTLSSTLADQDYIDNIKKENIILMAGRFGSKQKNYEIFLELLENNTINELIGWKIYLCGGMSSEFKERIDKLLRIHPIYKDIITPLGFVKGKQEIYKLLSRAKIFLHTASWEGDPNIQYEAMFCGCLMCSTDVANISQNYPKGYGIYYKINSIDGLKKSLLESIQKSNQMSENDFLCIQKYFLDNLTWELNMYKVIEKYKEKNNL